MNVYYGFSQFRSTTAREFGSLFITFYELNWKIFHGLLKQNKFTEEKEKYFHLVRYTCQVKLLLWQKFHISIFFIFFIIFTF